MHIRVDPFVLSKKSSGSFMRIHGRMFIGNSDRAAQLQVIGVNQSQLEYEEAKRCPKFDCWDSL